MSDKEKPSPKADNPQPGKPKRPTPPPNSKAALIWLIVLLILGGLLMFKNYAPEEMKNLNQSEFEQLLRLQYFHRRPQRPSFHGKTFRRKPRSS